MNCVMNRVSGAGSITQPVGQQSSAESTKIVGRFFLHLIFDFTHSQVVCWRIDKDSEEIHSFLVVCFEEFLLWWFYTQKYSMFLSQQSEFLHFLCDTITKLVGKFFFYLFVLRNLFFMMITYTKVLDVLVSTQETSDFLYFPCDTISMYSIILLKLNYMVQLSVDIMIFVKIKSQDKKSLDTVV